MRIVAGMNILAAGSCMLVTAGSPKKGVLANPGITEGTRGRSVELSFT